MVKAEKVPRGYYRRREECGVEWVKGAMISSPSPGYGHQRAVMRLVRRLDDFVTSAGLGRVVISPFDCILSEETVLQPDLLFISRERLGLIREHLHGAPDLAVEVLSSGSRDHDRVVKRGLYARHGVREYWIVDRDAKSVEVFTLREGAFQPVGYFQGGDALVSLLLPGFSMPLAEVFAE